MEQGITVVFVEVRLRAQKGASNRRKLSQLSQAAAPHQDRQFSYTTHARAAGTTCQIRCHRIRHAAKEPSTALDSTGIRCVKLNG
jgi:hypothetical protein